jgi:soluble lytic murein transglycosylase
MTGRSAKVVAAVLVCAAVSGGAVATAVLVFPRAAPALARKLANPFPKTRQEELETVLQRAARRLDGTMRTRLAEAIVSESERFGYDPFFILGLVSVESGFRPHVSSERGAYGLMQMQPSTFAWIAGRFPEIGDGGAVSEDPVIDVRLAIRYFHWLEQRFPRRDEALMAYNAGPSRLRHYKRVGIPKAVRAYPRKVMSEYQRFARMAGAPEPRDVMLARAN